MANPLLAQKRRESSRKSMHQVREETQMLAMLDGYISAPKRSVIKRLALVGRAGPIKRVHVDQAVIKRCRRGGGDEPAITIQTSAGPIKVHEVKFHGHARLVQRLNNPLSCGARVWIETTSALTIEP